MPAWFQWRVTMRFSRAVWYARGDLQIPPGVDRAALGEHLDRGVIGDA